MKFRVPHEWTKPDKKDSSGLKTKIDWWYLLTRPYTIIYIILTLAVIIINFFL